MRTIRIYGDAGLRRVSRAADLEADAALLGSLIPEMERLLAEEEGLGLAAPQTGENIRVFLVESSILPSLCGHRVFINPLVEPSGPPSRHEEGCLSVPGVYEPVVRPSLARVTALDTGGRSFSLELEGMAARVVQHENDHLDGVLFVDRLGSLRRKLLRSKLTRLEGL